MMNNIPNSPDNSTSQAIHEFSEDVLEFLSLLIEEQLRLDKLNKVPPE